MYDRDDVDEAQRQPGSFPNIDLLQRVYSQVGARTNGLAGAVGVDADAQHDVGSMLHGFPALPCRAPAPSGSWQARPSTNHTQPRRLGRPTTCPVPPAQGLDVEFVVEEYQAQQQS